MNADVEKAVKSMHRNPCVLQGDLRVIEQALRDQEAEITRLRDRLHEEEGNATELAKRAVRQRERAELDDALLRFLLGRFGSYMDESDKQAVTAHLGGEQ